MKISSYCTINTYTLYMYISGVWNDEGNDTKSFSVMDSMWEVHGSVVDADYIQERCTLIISANWTCFVVVVVDTSGEMVKVKGWSEHISLLYYLILTDRRWQRLVSGVVASSSSSSSSKSARAPPVIVGNSIQGWCCPTHTTHTPRYNPVPS